MISLNTSRHICVPETRFKFQKTFYSRFSFADFTRWKTGNDFRRNINLVIKSFRLRHGAKTFHTVEEHSARILRSWSRQLEFITAFRIRRTFQIITSYKKWWGSLNEAFSAQRFVNEIARKRYYFASCLAPFFEWNNERIPAEELSSLLVELHKTREHARQGSSYPINLPDSYENESTDDEIRSYCNCSRCQHLADDGWDLFYESNSFKIWRKEHRDHVGKGLYVYRVYGHFNDVSANDFFRVQVDTEYRKEWDPNSIKLEIVDSDTATNSDIIYWEFLFPKMFYNRDYVCNRRYEINEKKQYMAVVNQSVEHPACPEKPPIHRVREYWSHIVIRPTKGNFDEPGVEFTITYFDNPELLVPNSISVWYTINGMPDYINKQRNAALTLAHRKKLVEKIKERAAREETRSKDPEWASQETQGPHKRVLLL